MGEGMMARRVGGGLVLAVAALLLLPGMRGQDSKKCKPKVTVDGKHPQPDQYSGTINITKDKNCQDSPVPPSPTAEPSTAGANPFPTEESQHGVIEPAAPSAPAGAGKAGSQAPLPGDDADPPAESNKPMKLPRDGYSYGGSSSSSGDGGASSSRVPGDDDDVAPTTASPDAPVKASALKDLGSKGDLSAARLKLEETRFKDDLKVGKFYLEDGNAQGAYLRYKDAVEHVPDDPDARFGLAEAASKLNKRDEAILNYRETLKIDPAGDHDKAARAALKRLGVTP